ncbi:MAG: hypothetical protein ICV81_06505 [Flavisolibacter sp.]|nr:hypothetical protein [Flavisolibacter sp.]
MRKHYYHIIYLLRVVALSIVLLLHQKALSQIDIDTTTIVEDTVMLAPPIESEAMDTANYFDLPGMAERAPVVQRKISQATLNKLRNDDDFWYANYHPNRKPEKENPSSLEKLINLGWFKTLLWIIIISSFAAILIWFLIAGNTVIFRKKPVTTISAEDTLENANIFTLDFDHEVNKAAHAGNYRLAIRLMYVQVLKELSDKNLINYSQEKTNSDYVQQLWNSRYYLHFFRLTRLFEYVWYGQFNINQSAYASIRNDFATFKQLL